jgi:hypothetical protein
MLIETDSLKTWGDYVWLHTAQDLQVSSKTRQPFSRYYATKNDSFVSYHNNSTLLHVFVLNQIESSFVFVMLCGFLFH